MPKGCDCQRLCQARAPLLVFTEPCKESCVSVVFSEGFPLFEPIEPCDTLRFGRKLGGSASIRTIVAGAALTGGWFCITLTPLKKGVFWSAEAGSGIMKRQ
jgi:hypothetical protein